jgi:hypothetical protein
MRLLMLAENTSVGVLNLNRQSLSAKAIVSEKP